MLAESPAFAEFLTLDLTPGNRRLLETRCLDYFGLEHYRAIFVLLDLVLDQNAAAAATLKPDGSDRLFLDALIGLVETCPLVNGAASMNCTSRIQEIDEDFDFFFEMRGEQNWSLIRCMNFLYRSKIQPLRKIAIVTSIRNEGVNIIEWIAHHRLLGVDDFIIYANDNDDSSSELLRILAAQNIIHLIWNTTALGRDGGDMFSIQSKAYRHACEFLHATRQFEWLLFSDVDEFLVIKALEQPVPLNDLFTKLSAMPAAPAGVIFHWKCFTSQCIYRRAPGLNFQRFQHYSTSDHVKTIAKSDRCVTFTTSHMPSLVNGDLMVNGDLKPVAEPKFQMKSIVYGYGQINHYWNKSFEEFISKYVRNQGVIEFKNFFDYWGNRQRGPHEAVSATWIARLEEEINTLTNFPGISAAIREIEINFTRQLQDFDTKNGSEALFYKHFVKSI